MHWRNSSNLLELKRSICLAELFAGYFAGRRSRRGIVDVVFLRRFEDRFARLLFNLLIGSPETASGQENYRRDCQQGKNHLHSVKLAKQHLHGK